MQATARCAPTNANNVCEWSKRDSSFQDFVEWHASQPRAFPLILALHAFAELAAVRILVARSAREVLEVVKRSRLRFG